MATFGRRVGTRHNTDRCAELGVGVVLDALTATPRAIADAVDTVDGDGGDSRYGRAAGDLAVEAARQPRPQHLAELDGLLDHA